MTLREHLEAIRNLHKPVDRTDVYGHASGTECAACRRFTNWPCATRDEAVAALAILGSAERLGRISQRIWPDDDRVAVVDPKGAV